MVFHLPRMRVASLAFRLLLGAAYWGFQVTEPTPKIPITRMAGPKLAELRDADLDEEVAVVLEQVERPRINLGGSAPPGRAD